jgi:hypothetical protein
MPRTRDSCTHVRSQAHRRANKHGAMIPHTTDVVDSTDAREEERERTERDAEQSSIARGPTRSLRPRMRRFLRQEQLLCSRCPLQRTVALLLLLLLCGVGGAVPFGVLECSVGRCSIGSYVCLLEARVAFTQSLRKWGPTRLPDGWIS